MTHKELIAFRDSVAKPALMRAFAQTQIPEGACYIDNVSLHFLDGRSCGCESQFQASGYALKNGAAERYTFDELDLTVTEFFEAHKNCIFVTDGKLQVCDELSELELNTTLRNLHLCSRIFPALDFAPEVSMAYSPIEYYKLEHLVNANAPVVDMDTSGLAVDGYEGTWHTVDQYQVAGATYFLMEHDEYGDTAGRLIIDATGKPVLNTLYEGFDEALIEERQIVQPELKDKAIKKSLSSVMEDAAARLAGSFVPADTPSKNER